MVEPNSAIIYTGWTLAETTAQVKTRSDQLWIALLADIDLPEIAGAPQRKQIVSRLYCKSLPMTSTVFSRRCDLIIFEATLPIHQVVLPMIIGLRSDLEQDAPLAGSHEWPWKWSNEWWLKLASGGYINHPDWSASLVARKLISLFGTCQCANRGHREITAVPRPFLQMVADSWNLAGKEVLIYWAGIRVNLETGKFL